MLKLSIVLGMILLSGLWFAADARSQQPKKGDAPSKEDMKKMMEEWMALSKPGENHKHLERFVGTWTTTHRVWMDPAGKPTETKGRATFKWILGGRYLLQDLEGVMMGMTYTGLGLSGYDNVRNVFTSVWADTKSTQIIKTKGTRTPDARKTLYG